MRLNPKYFNLFIGVVAVVALVWIAFGTINYKGVQVERFNTNLSAFDSLSIQPLVSIPDQDTLYLSDFDQEAVYFQFWASWSDKAMSQLDEVRTMPESDSLIIILAAVKDVQEDIIAGIDGDLPGNLYRVDGTYLYGRLLAPGIPTYFFLKQGELMQLGVGYSEGAILDSLAILGYGQGK